MNMMRKNNNRNNMKHRNNGGQRRYQNNGGGGNRSQNDGQNLQRQKNHATQQLGKYNDMARNAQINGDRVDVEYYLQHVDHYTRVLSEIAAIEAERFDRQREQQQQSQAANEHTQGGDENAAPQDASSDESANASEGGDQAGQPHQQQQPRQYRQPRQHRQHQASDNGAKEANANTTEIPLPDNIIPPI